MHCLRYYLSPHFLFNKQFKKKAPNWFKAFSCYFHNIRSILVSRAQCFDPVKRLFTWKTSVRVAPYFFSRWELSTVIYVCCSTVKPKVDLFICQILFINYCNSLWGPNNGCKFRISTTELYHLVRAIWKTNYQMK